MNLTDFYNEVSRQTDTKGTAINVAETKRVLACAFAVLQSLSCAEATNLVAKGLAAAAKKTK